MVALKKKPSSFHEELSDEDDMEESDIEKTEDEESDSESGDEEVKLSEPSKKAIYNREGLLEKLEDIRRPDGVGFAEDLSVVYVQEGDIDVNDDLNREMSLFTQGLHGAKEAMVIFESMGIRFLRPPDYYAEMVKTDNHMEKVKGRLLIEKKNIEEAEERRKARESKKIAKEVQAQKHKERVKQKKDEFESVKKWRKQRQQSGFAAGDKGEDMGFTFEEGKGFERTQKKRPGVRPGDRSGGKARFGGDKGKKGMDRTRKSRERRDSKFGFGGRKGAKKQNTADTTNDFRGFNKGDQPANKKRKR